MKSKIKRFNVDPRDLPGAASNSIEDTDYAKAEAEMLKQFDEWREKAKPEILGVQFGRKRGVFLNEGAFYCHLEVLYLSDE